MLEQSIKETIQQGYRQFLKSRDLKPRLGQKQMIAAIANSLGHSDADKRLGVIEAGTGTGKTVGYLLSALPIARAKEKTVVVATGTIALQEQLILKDIPDLLEASGWDHQVALVKGRGRYVCNMRLEQCLDAIKSKEAGLFLFEDEMPFNPNAQSEALYQELSESLENNSWDGDRDAWDTRIPDTDWQTLTVDHRQCTGRRCQFVDQCPFFKARAELEEADCIVANHDLVMADLALGGGAILPPPEDCIYIFDEGHRLGETAVKHFGAQCRINTTLNWLERVPKQLKGQTPVFEKDKTIIDMLPRIDSGANEIVALLTTCYPQFQAYLDNLEDDRQLYRFPQGDVGEGTRELAQNISALTSRWIGRVELLRDTLNEALTDRDYAVPIPDIELFYQQVGSWLTKGENLLALWDRLKQQLTSHAVPLACWLRLDDSGSGNLDIAINASPIQATEILREQLWGSCYGAVITSATLRSLGNFNTLKRETGIPDSAQFLSVAGAFNYAEAATLSVPKDCVEGNAIYEHTDYITDNLADIVEKKAGTLVLFSSRRQMDEVFDRLDTVLQKICLVQVKYMKV